MSGLSGSWRVLRAARSGGAPWSWLLSQCPPLPTWAWKEGLRAPANPSQESPSSSGPLQDSVYTGKGLLSGPCRPSGSGPLGTPSPHQHTWHAPREPPRLVLGGTTHLRPPSCPELQGCPSPGWGGSYSIPSIPLPPPLSPNLSLLEPQTWSWESETLSLRAERGR